MTAPGHRVRQAGPEDTPAVCRLLGSVFPDNPKRHEDVLRWQYWDNPAGPACSLVVEDDGEVVAHYAAYPVRGVVAGRPVLLARGADGAIAAGHRRAGLFTLLGTELFRRCGEAGMPVTISNPNDRSVGALLRVGGELAGRPRVYVLPVDDRWLGRRLHVPARLARVARLVASVRGRPFRPGPVPAVGAELPGGLDRLWRAVGDRVTHGVVRDERWWRWRYGERPRSGYRFASVGLDGDGEPADRGELAGGGGAGRGAMAAAAVAEREQAGGRFAQLLELLATDDGAAGQVVRAVAADARERGLAGVAMAALPGTPLARTAGAAGFVPLPRRLQGLPLNLLVVDNTGDHPGVADAPWSFAWGDVDHL